MSHQKSKFAAVLFSALFAGLSAAGANAAESSQAGGLSADTNMGTLLDNPKTKVILEKHIPGISQGTEMEMAIARSMTLNELAPVSDGRLTEEMVKAVDAELRNLK